MNNQQKRKIQMNRVCNTLNDVITSEEFNDESVQIYFDKRDINKSEKAECYLKSTKRNN